VPPVSSEAAVAMARADFRSSAEATPREAGFGKRQGKQSTFGQLQQRAHPPPLTKGFPSELGVCVGGEEEDDVTPPPSSSVSMPAPLSFSSCAPLLEPEAWWRTARQDAHVFA